MNTKETFAQIMGGKMSQDEIKAVLTAYHEKGISPDDLMAAASAMREAGIKVRCDNPDAVERNLRIAIKSDKNTPYSTIKLVMNSLQDIQENRYNLLTELKSRPTE